MKKLRKYTLIILSAFLFLLTSNMHDAFAYNGEKVVYKDKDAIVKVNDRGNQRIVEVISYKNHKRFLYTINKSDIQLKTFDAKGRPIESGILASKKDDRINPILSSDKMLKARKPISWGKIVETTTIFAQRLWYQMGYRNKTTYMRIGCKARYTINYNDLSSWQIKRCEWYSKSIRLYNSYMDQLSFCFAGFTIIVSMLRFAFPLITGGLGIPAAAAAVGAAFGVLYKFADLVAKAANEYADADYFYDIIKVWA